MQDTPDSHLRVNPYPQLCRLRGRKIVDALFDKVFVDGVRVERLVERDVRLAHATVRDLSLVFVVGNNLPNRLSLIWRETKLLDRVRREGLIASNSGSLLGYRESCSHEEK